MKFVALILSALSIASLASAQSDSNIQGKTRKATYQPGQTRTSNPNAYKPPVMLLPVPRFQLVLRPDVRGELQIDNAMGTKIAEATLRAFPKNLKQSGDPEGQWRGLLKSQDEAVNRVIQSPARKRLSEIWMQYNGYIVASEYEVAKALELTDDQRAQIADALREGSKKLKEAQEKAGEKVRSMQTTERAQPTKPNSNDEDGTTKDPTPTASSIRPAKSPFSDAAQSVFRKEVNEVIAKILTDSQKEAFEKLSGTKFEFQGSDAPKPGKMGSSSTATKE
jgi:hypothetical protein